MAIFIVGYLPRLAAGVVLSLVAWLVASLLRGAVGRVLSATSLDERLSQHAGMAPISQQAGNVVFWLVLLMFLPSVLAERIGLAHVSGGSTRPSALAHWAVMFFAMQFAVVEASAQLGFAQVRDVVTTFIGFAGEIVLGGLILAVGFWLANLAYRAIDRASGPDTRGLAPIARIAILGIVIAMGLRAMGLANEVVILAFGLSLGAVAVAVALSFGLGGREAAGRLMEHWLSRWRREP